MAWYNLGVNVTVLARGSGRCICLPSTRGPAGIGRIRAAMGGRAVQLWSLVWLLLTASDGGHSAELRVARGFFTFIQPNDVPIRRSTAATHCKISVDLNDLSMLQVGTVHPHVRLACSLAHDARL